MSSSSETKRSVLPALSQRYQAALKSYLRQGRAANLKPALRLGQQALALGLETLDLAQTHERALLAQVASDDAPASRERTIKRAGAFFIEAIVPMERSHRGAIEANNHLSRVNAALNRRTLALAASNKQLKKEILRRQTVEKNLLKSEQHSNRLLEQSQLLQAQLRLLSQRIMAGQEEERKRISRELHDVIAQMLTGINVQLANLTKDAAADTKGISKKIAQTQRLVEKSVDSVHRFARELRPAVLDDLGLIPALHSFLKIFTKETGIQVNLTVFSGLEGLSGAKRTALYRVAQEALSNVARHARASRVEVRIQRLAKTVCMRIEDDGKSFVVERVCGDLKNRHLGLLGMRERVQMVGGTFAVESSPGKGTAVLAQIPFA